MKLIIGNLKMNLLKNDICNYINIIKDKKYSNVVFCPSSIYLNYFAENSLNIGSQDIGFLEKGSCTGDESALQLKSIGVKYSLVGHSERRKYYQDDKYVNQKLSCALNNDIIPILCIGETKEEYDNNLTNSRLKTEIDKAFNKIENNLNKVIIAYEPIWSIGTGITPSNLEITNATAFIKQYVKDNYSVNIKVLYGGSVNDDNILNLNKIENIDGYLIGSSSIDINVFISLINKINSI